MRKIFFIILLFGFGCTQSSNLSELLTNTNWQVEKVVNVKSGKVHQADLNHSEMWNFSLNNTYHSESKNDNQKLYRDGTWKLNEQDLSLIGKADSLKVRIENITDKEMIWVNLKNDSIRIYLVAKGKEIALPQFPDSQNANKKVGDK
jgi:hypothetical protein